MKHIDTSYRSKDSDYFSFVRTDIVSLVKGRDLSVLEIGCGSGVTLAYLKKAGIAKEAVGVDIHESSARRARKFLDRVIVGNIETMDLRLPKNHFDVIILADVLEHLYEPGLILSHLKKYLKKGGAVYASLPNIRVYYALFPILFKGDFGYRDAGVMDRTHLRFYCKKNIRDLFSQGFPHIELIPSIRIGRSKKGLLNALTLGLFEEFLSPQYLVVARDGVPK